MRLKRILISHNVKCNQPLVVTTGQIRVRDLNRDLLKHILRNHLHTSENPVTNKISCLFLFLNICMELGCKSQTVLVLLIKDKGLHPGAAGRCSPV